MNFLLNHMEKFFSFSLLKYIYIFGIEIRGVLLFSEPHNVCLLVVYFSTQVDRGNLWMKK